MFRIIIILFSILLFSSGIASDLALAENENIQIGLLATRDPEDCREKWTSTAQYLTRMIQGKTFTILPLDYKNIYDAVKNDEIDFILTNPAFYVELEALYKISQIATLKNKVFNKSYTEYSSVVFTIKNREDIQGYKDLKGKTYMAVHKKSFGGWIMAWREFKRAGIDPFKDFMVLKFGETHDAVVYAVRDGQADAGSVRTDMLERMQAEGKIQIADFKIIHEHGGEKRYLPFVHSTRSYPERPLAKLKNTPIELAEKVAIALIDMPQDSVAAQAAGIFGWTIPLNYQDVHACMKELKIGPYKDFGKIILIDIFKKYWFFIFIDLAALVVMGWFLNSRIKFNQRLKTAYGKLQSEVGERIKTEETLRKTRDYLDNLFNSTSAPIVVWDPENRITRYNNAFERLTGYKDNAIVGQKLQMLFSELNREKILQEIFDTLSSSTWKSLEIPILRFDGEVRIVLWNSTNIYAKDDGKIISTVAQSLDITKRKQAEEKIYNLNAVLRLIRNINHLMLTEKDPQQFIQLVCNSFVKTRGYHNAWIALFDESGDFVSAAEAGVGKEFSQIMKRFKRGEPVMCCREALEKHSVTKIEKSIEPCKDCPLAKTYDCKIGMTTRLAYEGKVYGTIKVSAPAEMRIDDEEQTFFKEVAGEIAYALHVIKSELSKKESQKILRQSEKFNKSIINNSNDCIKILDLKGRLMFISQNGQRLMGIEDIGLYLNQSWTNLWKGSDNKIMVEAFAKAKQGYSNQFQICCPTEKGIVKWWDTVISPMVDKDGRVERLLAVSRDISAQKTMEEQYRQAQKMEAIGTLTGGIAHDFNNLMSVIIGNADLSIMAMGKDDPLRENIEEIKKYGDKAAVLTHQLLAFSRKQIIKPGINNFNSLLMSINKMFNRLIGEDVEILMVPEPELWPVRVDSGQMEQVIMNIVVNARDAMPKGGKLIIETANMDLEKNYFHEKSIKEERPGSYVMLSVTDTGIGMDKETLSHIFEPFFTTKEIGKGTGLGMSTVYGIVKQNNGFVWADSEPGQGTSIKIYFPREMGDVTSIQEEQPPLFRYDGSENILVVEDDNSLLKFIQKVLQSYGYTILAAENGETALRIIKKSKESISLMITDVVMPKMNGQELADKLTIIHPHIKVIYMSGYTDDAIAHHGVLEPGLNFLEKPFLPENLARMVRVVLDK